MLEEGAAGLAFGFLGERKEMKTFDEELGDGIGGEINWNDDLTEQELREMQTI